MYCLGRMERDVAPWLERSFMVRCVVGSILHGGPIELILVPARVQMLLYVLSCLWDGA